MRVSQQIGWSQEGKLIYEIIKELRKVGNSLKTTNGQAGLSKEIGIKNDVNLYYEWLKELSRIGVPITTTTTTTAIPVPGNVEIPASTDFDIDGDFTIEFFMNLSNTDGFPRVYSFSSYPAPNAISIEGGGSIIYFWANGSAALAGVPGDVGVDLVGNWNHIAIVGDTGTSPYPKLTMYVNGNFVVEAPYYGAAISSGGFPLTIGFGNEPSSYFNGYLASFRWTDSVVYPAPFSGSVPTAPLPNITNCKLLIFEGTDITMQLSDNSGNGNDATGVGGVNYSSSNPFSPSAPGSLQLGIV